jgi:hypothetical protein
MNKVTKFATAIAVALPMLGIAVAGPAEARDRYDGRYETAQRYDRDGDRYNDRYNDRHHDRAWTPKQVRRHMRQYFDNIGTPRRDGDFYYLVVSQKGDREQNVRVNAYTGHVEYMRDVNRRDRRGHRNWR